MMKDSCPCGCVVNSSILNYGVILPRTAKSIWSSIQTDYGSSLKKSYPFIFLDLLLSPHVLRYGLPMERTPQTEITTDFKVKQLEKNL